MRLEAWVLCGNERSIRLAERVGFVREGVLRSRLPFDGRLRDVVVLSMLRTDRRGEPAGHGDAAGP